MMWMLSSCLSPVPQQSFPNLNMEVSIVLICFLKISKTFSRFRHMSQGHNPGNFSPLFLEHSFFFFFSQQAMNSALWHSHIETWISPSCVVPGLGVTKLEIWTQGGDRSRNQADGYLATEMQERCQRAIFELSSLLWTEDTAILEKCKYNFLYCRCKPEPIQDHQL